MTFPFGLFLFFSIFGQQPPVDLDNVPSPIGQCMQARAGSLEISRRINPFYLRGDFNGDGRLDFVVLVQDRKSKKEGFAFCFAGNGRPHIAGAGNRIALEGGLVRDDLAAFDVWGVAQAWSKRPTRDALYLEQAEAGSGVLIWNGRAMVWRQTSI